MAALPSSLRMKSWNHPWLFSYFPHQSSKTSLAPQVSPWLRQVTCNPDSWQWPPRAILQNVKLRNIALLSTILQCSLLTQNQTQCLMGLQGLADWPALACKSPPTHHLSGLPRAHTTPARPAHVFANSPDALPPGNPGLICSLQPEHLAPDLRIPGAMQTCPDISFPFCLSTFASPVTLSLLSFIFYSTLNYQWIAACNIAYVFIYLAGLSPEFKCHRVQQGFSLLVPWRITSTQNRPWHQEKTRWIYTERMDGC